MISKVENRLRKVCRNYEQVENYEKAIADEENKWDLHHRREIDENKSAKQLQEDGKYYDVDPEELIFLTHNEHIILHHKGKHHSEETRKKMSDSRTGEKNGMFGKKHSEETRKKISAIHKGKVISEETRKKLSYSRTGEKNGMFGKKHSEETKTKISKASVERNSGRFWWNNGTYNKFSKECPGEDFVRGRLKFNK